ncbi:hypothetical protein [Parabacteroides sp. PFB2-10]|uniref:hypothetical protein n=1 Tax=Parabacteroides sp. PFB2-10 TaxID=1742405 RepID=UPI002473D899|nr:hypothetical protein [Parabacteroides sp. PFB2-10]
MNKEFRPSGGNCYVVLELLRASQRSDSIAVAIFKEEYELIDMPLYLKKQLLEQNQLNIIHFFALENNKKYKCKSKVFKGIVPVLLVE